MAVKKQPEKNMAENGEKQDVSMPSPKETQRAYKPDRTSEKEKEKEKEKENAPLACGNVQKGGLFWLG